MFKVFFYADQKIKISSILIKTEVKDGRTERQAIGA